MIVFPVFFQQPHSFHSCCLRQRLEGWGLSMETYSLTDWTEASQEISLNHGKMVRLLNYCSYSEVVCGKFKELKSLCVAPKIHRTSTSSEISRSMSQPHLWSSGWSTWPTEQGPSPTVAPDSHSLSRKRLPRWVKAAAAACMSFLHPTEGSSVPQLTTNAQRCVSEQRRINEEKRK